MQRITNQSHNLNSLTYLFSRLFEKAGYYGLRALIVLYLVGDVIQMSNESAIQIYGWLATAVLISNLVGALLGDLLIGNRKAMLLGGLLQPVGAFVLCIPNLTAIYIGLGLVALGGGLYTPNLISNFSKSYRDRPKLLDAAFSMMYMIINFGSFIGILLIGYVSEEYSHSIGFFLAGVFMLIALISLFFSKNVDVENIKSKQFTSEKGYLKTFVLLILLGLFWAIYEVGDDRIYTIGDLLGELAIYDIPASIWSSLSAFITLPMAIFLTIIWSYFYSDQFVKLKYGFFMAAFAYALIITIPAYPTSPYVPVFILSIIFITLSELFIGPIVLSAIARYTDPKYLAIAFSLISIPIKVLGFVFTFFGGLLLNESYSKVGFAAAFMLIIGIGLVIFSNNQVNRYKSNFDTLDSLDSSDTLDGEL